MEKFRDGELTAAYMMLGQAKINHLIFFLCVLFLLKGIVNKPLHAEVLDGISLGSGSGVSGIKPIRLGLQKHFNTHWCCSEDDRWPITGYWELSLYHLRGKAGLKPGSHHKLNAITFAPVFRFQYLFHTALLPYIEVGIGISWFSRKEILGRDLGLNFQFEDRCSIGLRFGKEQQYDVAYRVVHFSNAYIGPSNHGLNIHLLTLGYWFN